MVKALGWKLRDLGLSPSWHSPFPAIRNCSRENYLLIHISNLRNVVHDNEVFKAKVLEWFAIAFSSAVPTH